MATELILTESIEKLTPALIAFNNDELLAYASKVVAKYEGIVYDEGMMKEAKEDRAAINRIVKALDDERKRIKKIYNQPMDKFTSQINEVIECLNVGANGIDKQVKIYEETQKQQKRAVLVEFFNSIVGELADCVTFEQIEDARWLNATVTEKKAKTEISAKLEEINDSINVIRGLGSENEEALLVLYFRTLNLAKALQENDRLNKEKQRVIELQKRREEQESLKRPEMEEKPVEIEASAKQANVVTEKPQESEFTVILEVTGTPAAMEGLMNYIKQNEIKVVARKK